ncbi:MAG: hypothetical protein DRJ34_05810, partial [Thermoprotei archaeon]
DNILFLIAGNGPLLPSLLYKVNKYGLKNIIYLGVFPFKKMRYLYNIADLCLLSYDCNPYVSLCLPKKFMEYAACGKPILIISPPCIVSNLCLEFGAGWHFTESNLDKATEIILALAKGKIDITHVGRRARFMAKELFSIEFAMSKLINVIRSIYN